MVVYWKHLLVLPFFLFYLQGCTTCHHVTISHSERGLWTADVRYRVCGSYSGYTVAVYKTSEGAPDDGEAEKEPFQAICKTEDFKKNSSPVNVEWEADHNLVIHHKTRMSIEDEKSKLMIIKADTDYQSVNIKYDPEPVIWDR